MIRAFVCWVIIAADFFLKEPSERRVVAERNGFFMARDRVDMALARDADGAFVDAPGELVALVDDVRVTPPLVPDADVSLLLMVRYAVLVFVARTE